MNRFISAGAVLIFLLILIIPSNGCAKSPEKQQAAEKQTAKQSSAKKGSILKFKTFSYVDAQGIGIEAFRFLMPSDWKFEGGIKWVLDNPGMPAAVSFKTKNPGGREELEVFPNLPFFWTNNPMLLSTFPIGSRYFGNEVRQPLSPLDALKSIVIPRFRRNVNYKIVSEQRLPELAKALGAGAQSAPGVTSSADAAKIRIEYQKDGVWMEEEIYGVVELIHFSMPSMYGTITNTNWFADYLFSFKAEKGKLDDQLKVFQAMIYSFKINPKWFNKYNQLVEYLVQMQIKQIQNIGEISRIISRTHNEISNQIMQSYNQRQKVYDKIADNFSQYIRGVDKYQSPIDRKPVELPSGYQNAWANSFGEYILSDNPNYNPNAGSNQNWQKMEKGK